MLSATNSFDTLTPTHLPMIYGDLRRKNWINVQFYKERFGQS